MATPLEDPRIGTVVDGRYRVLERIAAGGMGVVYRGERIQIARPVAIKFLLAPFAGDGAFRKRFELEARALSRLSHPNCVSIIDFGVADAPYLVMDFITGRTVQELLDLQGPMAPGRVVAIARQMLAGISHAHGQGIIHRDIKPGNVMVTEDVTGTGDYVRILDFGLAKLRDAGSSISGQKLAVGTPTYMAPEQVLGENVDERSDVYAAGALLFEMLSGKKAFGDAELAEILHHKTAGAVPALRDVAPGCSPAMEQVLQRAMAKEPADRYPSTKALLEALQQTPEASAQRPMAFADTVSLESIEAAPVDPDAIAAAVYSGATTLPAGAPVAAEAAKRASQRQRGGSRRTLFVTLLLLALLGGAAAAYLALGRDTGSAPGSAAAGSSTAGSARATSAAGSGSSAGSAIETNARATASADTVADTAAARADAAGAARADADAARDADATAAAEADGATSSSADAAAAASDAASAGSDAASAAAPAPAPTLRLALKYARSGKRGAALAVLRALQAKNPKAHYASYLAGKLYFETRAYAAGIRAYRRAILDRRYRRLPRVTRDAIRALGSSAYNQATTLLMRVGRPALPQLRRAARHHKNRRVRARARWLTRYITRHRRRPRRRKRRGRRRRRRKRRR